MNIVNTWQFNLIGYLITIVGFFQFYKLAVRAAKRDGAATILLQTIAGISILLLTPFLPFKISSDPKIYALLILASVFYAINDRLQTTVRKNLQISLCSILNQLSTVFLIMSGLLIFREPFVVSKIAGGVLIVLGNTISLYRKGRIEINRYIWLAILANMALASAMSIDIGISRQFNLPFYIMLTLILPSVMIMVIEKIKIEEIINEYQSKNRKYYLITGLMWGLAIFFSLRSFQFGKVTTIVPLQALSALFNIMIAYLFLKERDYLFKKIIAAILIIFGVFLTV